MTVISIEDIDAGMVLAEDVVDQQGRILLRKLVELSDKHIRILKTWGVMTVKVDQDGDGNKGPQEYPPEWQVEAKKLLDAHFQTANQDSPLIEKLKIAWVDRYLANKNDRSTVN